MLGYDLVDEMGALCLRLEVRCRSRPTFIGTVTVDMGAVAHACLESVGKGVLDRSLGNDYSCKEIGAAVIVATTIMMTKTMT